MATKELINSLPQTGQLIWIGLRPERMAPINVVDSAQITLDAALTGDRFSGKPGAKRQITLIQKEHLAVIGTLLGRDPIDPEITRRNLVVEGINLQALKSREFKIGEVVLFGTGNCAPCSRMEEALGPGGFNAMRGHGGITARVVSEGSIRVGDSITALAVTDE